MPVAQWIKRVNKHELTVRQESINPAFGNERVMGRFTIFLTGRNDGLAVECPASCVGELEKVVASTRFLSGALVDVPDEDGVCSNRAMLIPISRIQLIMEGAP